MPSNLRQALSEVGEAVLNGYSGVYFSNKQGAGLLFMAATMVWPIQGLAGLFCALTCVLFAYLMGFDRTLIRLGLYSVNALLVGLALAYRFPMTPQLLSLLALAGVMTALTVSCLKSLFEGVYNLPQFSMAFVLITVIVYAVADHQGQVAHASPVWSCPIHPPPAIEQYFKALAAVFFRNNCAAGLLVFAGLLYSSRIATALSIIGFISGSYFYNFGSLTPSFTGMEFAGYNFAVCAIAIGGVYSIPSLSSYCIAALSAALCAPVAQWASASLHPFGTDILALPFLMVSYMVISGLRVRPMNEMPELVLFPAASPEENLAVAQSRRLRQKGIASAGLRLPFIGAWHVTQGINGEYTHKDKWRYALDFSLPNEDASPPSGPNTFSIFPAYGLPVAAPQFGVVTRIVDGLADNDPGRMDIERNWGNYVSLRHEDGTYSLMAHLKKSSIRVKPGDRVSAGEVLALCGNSGRSPTPHIHYHLQKTAEPGSETLPFTFSSYVKLNGAPQLAERSLPEKGEAVGNLIVSPMMRSAFDLMTGSAYHFEVEHKKGKRLETLVAAIDLYGWRYLESMRDRSRLYYHSTQDMFYMSYCSAKPGSLLFAFLLAASKVPLVEMNRLSWKDELPLNSFLRGPARLGAGLFIPFLPGYGVEVVRGFCEPGPIFSHSSSKGADEGEQLKLKRVGIQTNIATRFPWSFEQVQSRAVFCEGTGPLEISVASKTPGLNLRAIRIDA